MSETKILICPACGTEWDEDAPEKCGQNIVQEVAALRAERDELKHAIDVWKEEEKWWHEEMGHLRADHARLRAALEWIARGPTTGPGAPTMAEQAHMQAKRAKEALEGK